MTESNASQADLNSLRIDRERPRSGGGWIIAALLAVIGTVGIAFAWQRFGGTRPPDVTTELVRRVGPEDAGAILSAGGYLLPTRRASVSSKTFGRLEWLGVDVGSKVRKDEVIGRLANADLTARLEEFKADLDYREHEYARYKKAIEDGVEPRERLDRAENELNVAKKRVETARAELDYTQIRAPFDGVVVRKMAEIGETVGPAGGTAGASTGAIVVIVDPASIEMVADVNETNIAKVKVDQRVEVAADAMPERKIPGKVRQIVPTADRQKGIVQVKIQLLEIDERLLSEMAARATFLRDAAPSTGPRRILVPKSALRGGFVFLVEAGRAKRVAVETGAEGEDGIEIKKGLLGGEVVITGGDPVEDGVEVRVKGKS